MNKYRITTNKEVYRIERYIGTWGDHWGDQSYFWEPVNISKYIYNSYSLQKFLVFLGFKLHDRYDFVALKDAENFLKQIIKEEEAIKKKNTWTVVSGDCE